MQCKTCQYALWQIKPGPCPECGSPFKPSDFEFVGNAVRFCCPHCNQAYYGTDQKGHIDPPRFTCVGCDREVHIDEMVLLPTQGVSEEQTKITKTCWADRRDRSWFAAFFSTTGMAMGNPNRAIDDVPMNSSVVRATLYALPHLAVQSVLGMFFLWILSFGMLTGLRFGVWAIVLTIVFALLLPVVFMWMWILSTHAILRLTGKAVGGLSRTAHAIAYSVGNNSITAIPCFGFYFCWAGMLWWAISAGFMLARGQAVRGWRAGVAIATPLVVVGLVLGGLAAWGIYEANRASQRMASNMPVSKSYFSNDSAAASSLAGSLSTMRPGATMPRHAAELLLNSNITVDAFILPSTQTDGKNSTLLGYELDDWGYKSFMPNANVRNATLRTELTQALGDPGLPQYPAHRVGDWVFVYEGQDLTRPTQRMWIAIGWPDPFVNDAALAEVPVIHADWSVEMIKQEDFEARLSEQNTLRTEAGMEELPHPEDVWALDE